MTRQTGRLKFTLCSSFTLLQINSSAVIVRDDIRFVIFNRLFGEGLQHAASLSNLMGETKAQQKDALRRRLLKLRELKAAGIEMNTEEAQLLEDDIDAEAIEEVTTEDMMQDLQVIRISTDWIILDQDIENLNVFAIIIRVPTIKLYNQNYHSEIFSFFLLPLNCTILMCLSNRVFFFSSVTLRGREEGAFGLVEESR